jgi:D-alanyl-D-alanine carboxypeptidase/D-alanyl-D-alanine-endopeptidase (penicillin-binding protein 4)
MRGPLLLGLAGALALLLSVAALAQSPHYRGDASPRRAAQSVTQAMPRSTAFGGASVRTSTSAAGVRHPPATAASTGPTAALAAALGHQMAIAGPNAGSYVYDITAGTPLYSDHAAAMHPPASVEKLYTSITALIEMGPTARLSTTVYGAGKLAAGGVWEGNIYLRGGGDPTFGSGGFIGEHYGGQGASVSTLVQQLIYRDGIRRITGRVLGDETYFDSLRGEPSSGYAFDPWLEGVLSGLAFDRGETGSSHGPHAPAAYAAEQLMLGLQRSHVSVQRGSGPAPASTPSGARELAVVQSPPLSTLLGLMLPPSDNFFAEMLIKDLGARFGGGGTTADGAAVVRATIGELGLHPHVVDGSGLSREDLTSPEQVVDLLRQLSGTSSGEILRGDLAVAGRTGTLEERMRHTYAEGRCEAKTGTLTGVSNLAGYCQARNGHLIAFALFDDGIETNKAHTIQDAMTESLAGY